MNDLAYLLRGCSLAVEERAKRLLVFVLGYEATGAPVTVAALFARSGLDPIGMAQHLMRLSPAHALEQLGEALSGFTIAGHPCQTPDRLARAALAHAGRAV